MPIARALLKLIQFLPAILSAIARMRKGQEKCPDQREMASETAGYLRTTEMRQKMRDYRRKIEAHFPGDECRCPDHCKERFNNIPFYDNGGVHLPPAEETTMTIQTDWAGFQEGLRKAVIAQLKGVIQGGVKDLEGPVADIAVSLSQAAKRGNAEAMEACRRQLQVLLETNEARLKHGGSEIIDFLIGPGLDALVAAAVAGLRALKAV